MRYAIVLFLLVASTAQASVSNRAANYAKPSKAVTSDILDAVAFEMNRAMSEMRIPNEPKPYFISYKVTEVDVSDVSASLGHVTAEQERHIVSIEASVRVGSYQFDNSNFVIPDFEQTDGQASVLLPLEATPRSARRAAWMVTDAAYKEAVEQHRAKVQARVSSAIPSHVKAPAIVKSGSTKVLAKESLAELKARAEAVSREFRKHKHVRDSRVAMTSFIERRWYLNTEGTSAEDARRVSGLVLSATAQAPDGSELADFRSHYGISMSDLPSNKELSKEVAAMGTHLKALATAKVAQPTSAPVLFEGQAAGFVVRYGLARHLGGTPLPAGMSPDAAKRFGGGFRGKLGRRVMPKFITVVDDPTRSQTKGGDALIGGYEIDDEGVAGQAVTVVERGQLKSFLTSKTPSTQNAKSNGHARRTGPGGVFHGSSTNLFVSSRKGLSSRQLRRKLIATAKDQGAPFGIVIRRIDDSAITAVPELSMHELRRLIQTSDLDVWPRVIEAYRVYPNGKEELIRGLAIKTFNVNKWKDLLAAGKTLNTYNYLESGEHFLAHKVRSSDDGFVPSSGIETGISTPDLLFSEMDFTQSVVRFSLPAIDKP